MRLITPTSSPWSCQLSQQHTQMQWISSRQLCKRLWTVVAATTSPDQTPDPSEHTPQPADWLQIAKIQTQIWAAVLPLGYAGVPLAAAALKDLPAGPALAAAGVETLTLAAVATILTQYKTPIAAQIRLEPTALGLGAASGLAAFLINQLLPQSTIATNNEALASVLAGGNDTATAALFLASVVLAPATEELMYRGFLLPSLQALVPTPVAVVLSGGLFAVAHVNAGAQGTVQLLIVGSCLGAAYVASRGNLMASFLGHSLYNAILVSGLMLSDS